MKLKVKTPTGQIITLEGDNMEELMKAKAQLEKSFEQINKIEKIIRPEKIF